MSFLFFSSRDQESNVRFQAVPRQSRSATNVQVASEELEGCFYGKQPSNGKQQ